MYTVASGKMEENAGKAEEEVESEAKFKKKEAEDKLWREIIRAFLKENAGKAKAEVEALARREREKEVGKQEETRGEG